jgi:ferric-dicitrate binding protein FerR (iron transport regulator)
MLTPEEKQRIEEEERKRHAEEQYRAQIRSRLQRPATPSSLSQQSGVKPRPFLKILAAVAACAIAVVVISNLVSNSASKGTANGGASSLFAPKTV